MSSVYLVIVVTKDEVVAAVQTFQSCKMRSGTISVAAEFKGFILLNFLCTWKLVGADFRHWQKWRRKSRKICILTLKSSCQALMNEVSNSVCDNIFPCLHHPSASHEPEQLLSPLQTFAITNSLSSAPDLSSILCSELWPLIFSVRTPLPVGVQRDGRAPPLTGSPCCSSTLRPSSVFV